MVVRPLGRPVARTAVNAAIVEGLVRSLLLSSFDDPAEIPECHKEWWEACCSPNRYVAIAAPRGFAKSTAITHSYLLTKLLFRESRFAIIVSDTESQSTLFLNDIKKELQTNENLRALFQIKDGPFAKDTETDIIVEFADGEMFRIMAKGSEQKLRGLKWDKKRPDLIICDDMENDELVMNKERRDKLKRWFTSALLPVMADRGIIRMVGTILHADSLLANFMPVETSKDTIVTPIKVYMRNKRPGGWYSMLYRAHNPDYSMLLWPEWKTEEKLRTIRREIYEKPGLLDLYSQEYLNNPIDEANRHFKPTDFLPETLEDKELPLTYYITFDGAWSEKQKSDYTAILVSGLDSKAVLHLRHMIRGRMDPLEVADTIFTLVKLYDPLMVVTEKGAYAHAIQAVMNKRMQEDDVYFRVETLNPAADKVHRSQAARLRARAGKVKADKGADWWPSFEDELLAFPRGKYDDQVDAFSLVGQVLNKFIEAPTQDEMIEEAREQEMEDSGMYEQGRSEVTGY